MHAQILQRNIHWNVHIKSPSWIINDVYCSYLIQYLCFESWRWSCSELQSYYWICVRIISSAILFVEWKQKQKKIGQQCMKCTFDNKLVDFHIQVLSIETSFAVLYKADDRFGQCLLWFWPVCWNFSKFSKFIRKKVKKFHNFAWSLFKHW